MTTAAGPETEGPVLVFNPPGVVHRDRFVDVGGYFLAVSFAPTDWRTLADAGRGAAIDALRLTGPRRPPCRPAPDPLACWPATPRRCRWRA